MAILTLLRHGQSQWNLENKFTGWVDVPLTAQGETEAKAAGEKIKHITYDKAYTSELQRAQKTLELALEVANQSDLPTEKHLALNERHYGDLQGMDKAETAKKYSPEQVHIWRRSYDVPPPGEKGESLKDTAARTLPYFDEHIIPDIKAGKNIIIAAHGNSLRSIVMQIDKLTKEQVLELNIGTGVPIVYEMDANAQVLKKEILK
ncbi:MAG: 2,3-bisphosphoglycerate-dependent phosphoglycerate mutase [Candidatus Omnitrophota bacterium]|jgi:2,3-bisphosphoglycerate-dependent phosphoglycerate mutase